MRTYDGAASMAIEARATTSAQAAAGLGDPTGWGGTLSSCVGAHLLFCPVSVAAGATAVLDESMDWRDRVCMLFASLAELNAEDRRPGGLNEAEILPLFAYRGWRGESFYSAGGWDGNPATPRAGVNRYSYANVLEYSGPSVRDIYLYADSANGFRLTLKNGVANKVSGVITILCTEPLGKIVAVP